MRLGYNNVKGALHPKLFLLISIFFHSLKFKYVHRHTLEANIFKKLKNSSRGVRDSTERPKIEDLKIFLPLFFNRVFAHILYLNYKNILILKKIDFGHFRVQNPLIFIIFMHSNV